MTGASSKPSGVMSGRIGLDASAEVETLPALRLFAPLAIPVICQTRADLLDRLESRAVDFAFIALGDYRSGTVIDCYTTMSERDVSIIGEHLHDPSGTRFVLLAQGHWSNEGLRFRTDMRAGDLWLDMPVLGRGRTSILFALPDEPGALVRALGAISRRHLNLSKLEMRPPDGSQVSCTIVAEIDGYAHDTPVKEALTELHRLAAGVRVLGAYPAAG